MGSADVVVLGAGPAGLGAAYRLARAGRSVVVLERADEPGGLAGSFEVAGVRVDHGSHRLHPACPPPVLETLRELLGPGLRRRPRRGRLRLAGRWVAFPPRLGDLARHVPARVGARLAADVVAAPFRAPRGDGFADVARARLGPTLAEHVHLPFARKIWGLDPEELDGELARRRVGTRSPAQLVRGLGPGRRDRGWFWYPQGGFGRIVERLAEAAVEAGAELRLGAEVRAVELGEEESVVAAGGVPVRAGQVWSTLPLPILPALVSSPAAPPEVVEAAGALRHRALVLVYLVLEQPRYTPFDAHYLPGPAAPCSRVSEPRNYREGGDDPPDRTVLCAEVPCDVGDRRWHAPPEALGDLVAEGLEREGLPPCRPVAVEVRRVAHAYPVYRRGFRDVVEVVDWWASGLPGLLTLGRQGLFVHDNTHHALAMAWAAADALDASGRVDPARWVEARASFCSHVVED